MQFLWNEASRRNIRIHVTNAWVEKPKQRGDVFLMDLITRTTSSTTQLKRINVVRLYMRVYRLSDIANEAGNKIEKWALNGEQHNNTGLQ